MWRSLITEARTFVEVNSPQTTIMVNCGALALVEVPAWIMAILYADPLAAGATKGGEIRFEAESGLNGLRQEWPNLTKRIIRL
jgi:hypothetical protein